MGVGGKDLIDLVLSWSIDDVLNTDLYKDQVKTIPFVFSSEKEYLNSFINPLIEETHVDLLSSFTTLSHASSSEIESVKRSEEYKPPKDLLYEIELSKCIIENDKDLTLYEPEVGDIIAITSVRPKYVSDLDRPERSYLIAHVKKVKEKTEHFKLSIQLSRPTLVEDSMGNAIQSMNLFAVKLINMTTSVRIWNALNSDSEAANRGIIRNVLHTDFLYAEHCTICHYEQQYSDMRARLRYSDLNESQKDAVLSCIRTRECHHQNTVKMIWGPPGTGKTKTVGFLLHLLLRMECRTLTCAPTNTAIVQVTKRLVEKVKESSEFRKYGLGDIVLFGNSKRMKIDDHDDLYDIFLDHRADMLQKCLNKKSGWEDSVRTMINLLKEPEKQYRLYLKDIKGKCVDQFASNGYVEDYDLNLEKEDVMRFQENGHDCDRKFKDNSKKGWRRFVVEALEQNKNKPKDHILLPLQKQEKSKPEENDGKHTEEEKVPNSPLTFGEFVKKMFDCVREQLYFFTVNLHAHLPTSVISLEDVKKMFAAIDSLKSFQPFLREVPNEDLKEAYSRGSCFTRFNVARVNSLFKLESLPFTFPVPYSPNRRIIKEFCLEKACLIFCTASGSAKLHIIDMPPLELLVIDEAAQLKECESAIPLQLPGVRHAILVGDERQLPAMVKSQICEEVYFGRSLFERLAFLEHKKYLLNVQYRMHPSISLFPNREFYGNQILDGENVSARNYNRCFLHGKMYKSYSFIDVSHGKEEFDDKRSRKNMVEVAVVSEIVASLHKEYILRRRKVRVGVISPYKAQVHVIAEKIRQYTSHAQSGFFVSVRTVDGFQGGEEDVIIISTVRCNGIGSVSFLSSRQRGNVALTRARYCLWIVGSGSTLNNSGTFWKNLVVDAKERGCFHNAFEDKSLAHAITVALVELNQVSSLLNLDSLLFRESRWKVCFTDAFWRSVTRFESKTFCKRLLNLLEKLSNGWRQPHIGGNHVVHGGISSQLVEYYMVNTQLYLIWTVDLLKENAHYIQVLKVWDILPQSYLLEMSNQLDFLYGSYSVDKMSRCNYKCYDGNLLIPMSWPVDSNYEETDLGKSISKLQPSSSSKAEPEISSTDYRNLVPIRCSVESSRTEADPEQLLSKSVASFILNGEPEVPTTNKNLIVPSHVEDDPIELLSKSFALLSLREESKVPSGH